MPTLALKTRRIARRQAKDGGGVKDKERSFADNQQSRYRAHLFIVGSHVGNELVDPTYIISQHVLCLRVWVVLPCWTPDGPKCKRSYYE